MDYRGFWRYKEKETMECGENRIEEGDIIYVISKHKDRLHISYNKKTITILYNNFVKYFDKENRRGHPPSKCKVKNGCELCLIWSEKRNC